MNKYLKAVGLALAMSTAIAGPSFARGLQDMYASAHRSGGYAAIAAGMQGSAYVEGYSSMEAAREAAVSLCRRRYGTSCSVTTAERSNWYFSAGDCDGEPYTGASPQSVQRANDIVFEKAAADGRSNCHIYANR